MEAVLLRAIVLALAWVVLAHLPDLAFGLLLPVPFVWIPALLLCGAGLWLVVAQRPTLMETAQLLDQRFRLHNALGTALELEANEATGFLAERQVALATARARALPDNAWPERNAREWQLFLLLLAGAVLTLLVPSLNHTVTPGSSVAASAPRTHALLAQTVPSLRTMALPGTHMQPLGQHQVPAHGRQETSTRFPDLSATLQVRAGSAQVSSGSGVGALTPGGTQGGVASGASTGRIAPAVGSGSRTGRAASGASAGSGRSAAAGQPGSGSTSGGQGAVGVQAPQAGVQRTSGKNSAKASASQGQSQGGSDLQSGQDGQGSQTSSDGQQAQASNGPNPFGTDAQSTQKKSNSTASSGTARGKGPATRQGDKTQAKTGASTSSHPAPTDQNGPDGLPLHGRGATAPQTKQPPTPAGKAGPARGKQIVLGGQYVLSPGANGPLLVRVVPPAATNDGGLNGVSGSGSGMVQGYVPENDMNLSPDEQSLVRTYFSDGAGP
jgi:hypothetical protein